MTGLSYDTTYNVIVRATDLYGNQRYATTSIRTIHQPGAGDLAGAVAALCAAACVEGRVPVGVTVTGDEPALSRHLLAGAIDVGVQLQEFTGVPRVSV